MRQLQVLAIGLLLAAALRLPLAYAWSNGPDADLVLGQANFTSGTSTTTQSGMNNPLGVAVDPSTGKVFVADTTNNRVLRFASLGSLSSGADAEAVLGQPNFTTTPIFGPATQSNMYIPYNLAVDQGGRLWVADSGYHRVLRFDNASSKANGAAADGVLGQSNFTNSAASNPPSQSGMNWPTDVAVDSSGHLWVAERFDRRVVRFDNASSKANGADADGVLGQPDFATKTITTTQSGLDSPYGLAIDGDGRLWVSDNGNNRVLRFDDAANKANGANADGVLGQATFTTHASGTTQNSLFSPADVAADSTGRVWVADGHNNRVLRFDNAAAKSDGANADGVLGQANFTDSAAATTASSFNQTFGLATDSIGNLWAVDVQNSRVLLFKDSVQVAIALADSSPTNATSVAFDVTFSSPITGLSAANFELASSGLSGASISSVAGSGTAWTVTVATGDGNSSGTLRLDVPNSTGVQDGNGGAIANVPYTSGPSYTITPFNTDVSTSLSYQRDPAGIVTFTLALQNLGPADASGTGLVATFPALPSGGIWNWTCSGSGGATCPISGTGDISTTLDVLPSAGAATYSISSTAPSYGAWTASVSATPPLTLTDTMPSNNSATARSYGVLLPLVER